MTSAVVHAKGDDHGISHPKRQKIVDKYFSEANAQRYEQLYIRSRLVRYDLTSATAADYEKLFQENFLPLLEEVRSSFHHLTGG